MPAQEKEKFKSQQYHNLSDDVSHTANIYVLSIKPKTVLAVMLQYNLKVNHQIQQILQNLSNNHHFFAFF